MARNSIYQGMKKVYDAVKVTMGPSGRNVLIENVLMKPVATKDGVTVANAIKLSDKKQDMGAQLIKSVSQKTADTSGDGTTTSTVLAFSLLDNGIKYLKSNPNANLIDYKRGMDYATSKAVELLVEMSVPCKSKGEVHKVAMISSNGDKEISDLVTEAVYTSRILNQNGTVSIETSNTFESSVDFNDAMVISSGFGKRSPSFVNDEYSLSANHEDVRVLIFDGSMGNIGKSVENVINQCYQNDEALVIIAKEFSNNVILNIVNNARNGLKCVIIESPEFGGSQKNILNDIAVATNTTVFGGEGSNTAFLETLRYDELGFAKSVQVFSDKSYIKLGINEDHANKLGMDFKLSNDLITETIKNHCVGIKKSVEKSKNDYEVRLADKRIENLQSIKSTINIYAMTEVEVEESKQRVEDAVFATMSAIEEGYVMGGGFALAKIASKLLHDFNNNDGRIGIGDHNVSFTNGYLNTLNSISQPMVQIMNNAFLHPNGFITNGEMSDNYDFIDIDLRWDVESGVNVRNREVVDNMYESGIIDPTKVIRCAMQNANSVSSLALTTECMIFSDAYYTEELSSKENHELMFKNNE